MKTLKLIILFVTLLAMGTAVTSCGNKSSSTTNTEQQGKEYTSAYVCPMHCDGSGSNETGECPVCGMDYVKNEDHNSDGHSH